VTVRATTIPESVAFGCHPAGSGGPRGPSHEVFPPGQRSVPAVSGLSQLSPPLLLPGCGGPTPRAVTGRDDSLPSD